MSAHRWDRPLGIDGGRMWICLDCGVSKVTRQYDQLPAVVDYSIPGRGITVREPECAPATAVTEETR